jgi:RNA polymerase sigma-70 factor (ECF subfamily)
MQPTVAERRLTDRNTPFTRLFSYTKLTDMDLVIRAKGGDKHALEVLVERHAPRVNRLAAHLLEDLEEARDAAQESLVKLCTRLRQFRGDAQFGTWLHRLVVNTCRDRMAWQRVRRTEPLPLEDTNGDGGDGDPADAALLGDLRRDVADALSKLSRDQRIAVVLRDSFGLSYEEIARVARMPVGTAKCYVHRARSRLRARLEEQGTG